METNIILIISLILAILFVVWINKSDKEKAVYVNDNQNLNYEYKLDFYLFSGELIEAIFYSDYHYSHVIDLIENCSKINILKKSKYEILKLCLHEDEDIYISIDKIIKVHVFVTRR